MVWLCGCSFVLTVRVFGLPVCGCVAVCVCVWLCVCGCVWLCGCGCVCDCVAVAVAVYQAARVKAMGFTKSHATTDTPLLDHSCWCRPTNLDSSHVLPATCRVWGAPGVVSHASAKAHTAALRHRARARSSSSMSGSGDADLDAALAMASDAGAPSSPAAQRGGTPTNKTAAAVRRRVPGGAPSTPESAAS